MGLFLNNYGGYIKSLKLNKFWRDLSTEEREAARFYFSKSFYPETINVEIIDQRGHKIKTEETRYSFLSKIGNRAITGKHYTLAEKCFIQMNNCTKDQGTKLNNMDKLIDIYYKQRQEKEDAVSKCIDQCNQSIKLYQKAKLKNSNLEAFKRLAIIHESNQNYEDAIAVSKLALKLGVHDGTKTGFEGRITKLNEKIS